MSKDTNYRRLITSRTWVDLRIAHLRANPYCEDCYSRGIYRAAQCVHHIQPVESGRTIEEMTRLCYSPSNLSSLCYACHSERHRAERSHSRAAHEQRTAEALERWKDAHKPRGG